MCYHKCVHLGCELLLKCIFGLCVIINVYFLSCVLFQMCIFGLYVIIHVYICLCVVINVYILVVCCYKCVYLGCVLSGWNVSYSPGSKTFLADIVRLFLNGTALE